MHELKKARLVLEDGTVYEGTSFGYEKSVSGEVVFYTAMTGYPESLTDPSYKGQILVPTYPMIGNYGVPVDDERDGISKFFESDKIHCKALVISDYSSRYSHWNSQKSLGDWLKEQQIPGLFGIDTLCSFLWRTSFSVRFLSLLHLYFLGVCCSSWTFCTTAIMIIC